MSDESKLRVSELFEKCSVSIKISNPDFVRLAESFGITAHRSNNLSQLTEQLQQSITSQNLSVIEVPTNPDVNNQLIEKLDNY